MNEASFFESKNQEQLKAEALSFMYETLEMDPDSLESFPQHLFASVEKLPRYKKLMQAIEDLDVQDIPEAVFEQMKRSNDPNDTPEGNGVLLNSMKQGSLECAGRSLIISRAFTNTGVEHAVAKPFGHTMLLVEQDKDTLLYLDANNNLLFSFPKQALDGYTGTDKTSEARLKPYTPREKDRVIEGVAPPMRHMMVMSPEKGLLHSYLGNIGAALDGKEEFANDDIPVNKEVADMVLEMRKNLLGKDTVPESFYAIVQKELEQEQIQKEEVKQRVTELFHATDSESDFIEACLEQDDIFSLFLYASEPDQMKAIAKSWYKRLQET